MTAVIRGLEPDSLKTRCSNEEGGGMVIALAVMSLRNIVDIPPLRPWWRGLSMYEYPGDAKS